MYAGEVIGEYTIVWVGEVFLRYRYTSGKKSWRTFIHEWHEWMEMMGHYRTRCNGRPRCRRLT